MAIIKEVIMQYRIGLGARRFFTGNSKSISNIASKSLTVRGSSGYNEIKKFFEIKNTKIDPTYLNVQFLNLTEKTVIENYETSATYKRNIESNILNMVALPPKNKGPKARLEYLIKLLYKYPPIPVVTAHPTRLFTNQAIYNLYTIVSLALQLDDTTNIYESSEIREKLHAELTNLTNTSIIQTKKLTPQQEVEYGEFIYRKAIESFPTFFNLLVNAASQEYKLDKQEITEALDPVSIFLYSQLRSWKVADRDGNESKDKHTMGAAIPEQQIQNLNIYISKTNEIIGIISKLKDGTLASDKNAVLSINYAIARLKTSNEFYEESIKSIKDAIWFDEEGSDAAAKTSIDKLNLVLEKLLKAVPNCQRLDIITNKILSLINLIKLCKFTGGYTHYHRQTTQLNTRVFNNIFQILVDDKAISVINILLDKYALKKTLELSMDDKIECIELDSSSVGYFIKMIIHKVDGTDAISELLLDKKFIRDYGKLSLSEKITLQELISKDSYYFVRLRANRHQFTPETEKELGVLDFILKNKDMFRYYIFSNTESKNNFDEGSILMRLAQFIFSDNLRIGEMNKYPVDFMFLLESPKDIRKENLDSLLNAIFNDKHLRTKISHSGFISAVLGPSDLGKEGGISTYLTLFLAQMHIEEALEKYKKIYPELANVHFLFLYGFGSDWKRYIGGAHMQSHVTLQGIDAYKVTGAPFGFLNFVTSVSGREPEGSLKVAELRKIRDDFPKLFNLLLDLESFGVANFEEFINQPALPALVASLSCDDVEDAANCSSRKKTKIAGGNTDFKKLRAIGVVNVFIYMLLHFDIFMGMRGWDVFTADNNKDLHDLYSKSSIIRDIVEKGLYAIAISDINRAWKLINQGKLPYRSEIIRLNNLYLAKSPDERTIFEVMAYIHISAEIVLRKLMLFAPPAKHVEIQSYLENNPHVSVETQAIDLLKIVDGQFHYLAVDIRLNKIEAIELSRLINYYLSEKNENTKMLVAAGIRGGCGSLFAGRNVFKNRSANIEKTQENQELSPTEPRLR